MLFLFWRVPPPSRNGEGAVPHTSQPCFSFLACTAALSQRRRGRSAHATTLLFFLGMYHRSLSTAKGALRTRHNLAFLFWRVPTPSRNSEVAAPHTPQPCFSFFGVYRHPLSTANGPLRTHLNLAFLFWRVPPLSRNGEVGTPHTLIHSFFENIPYQLINRLRIHWVVKRFKGVYNIIALIISILRIIIYLR